MRNSDLERTMEKAEAARMLMDYVMSRSMELHPCKGLEVLAPYLSRVDWIEGGHMYGIELSVIFRDYVPTGRMMEVHTTKDGEPVRFVEIENSIERMEDTIAHEKAKRARQRQKSLDEAERAAQRRRNAERRLREWEDEQPAYAYVYARG